MIPLLAFLRSTTLLVGIGLGIAGAEIVERSLDLSIGPIHVRGMGPTIAMLRAQPLRDRIVTLTRTIVRDRAQDAVTADVEAQHAPAAEQIRTVTRTIVERIHDHVTPAADAACTVPAGLVRSINAAATGADLSVPDASGIPDDGPSGLALSDVAASVVDNYGTARSDIRTLSDLRDWIRRIQAADTSANKEK